MKLSVATLVVYLCAAMAIAENQTESQKLQLFFDEEWEYGLKEDPIFASMIGDYRYNDQIGDASLEAEQRRQKHEVEALKKLQAIDRAKLNESERLNYDLYEQNLKNSIEGHRFPYSWLPINQMNGVQQVAAITQSLPFENAKHYRDYISRMNQMPVLIDQTIERLKMGLSKKVTPPKITLRAVADQIKAQASGEPEKSPFWDPFKEFPETVPAADQEKLRQQAKESIQNKLQPAYQKLHDYWTKEYYPNTRESIAIADLPDGEAWYTYQAKVSTTTDLTPKEIHEIGLREVKRIREEMERVMKQTGFKGSFAEFLEFLRTDKQFFYTRPEDLLTGYRDICKRIDAELPKLFGRLPRLPYGVIEIPEYIAPSQTTAYYNSGNLKAGKPGWFYANTYKLDTRPKWEMEALSIHEAVPGHHLQISIAQELEDVPNFRKYQGYTAFVEGWGLYSESLGEDMGMYKDPYSKFGQLTYDMWRAIRLVVDTGMHAFGWDRQKAIDFFKSNSSKPEHDITVEIDRYIVWPGQALAYKIGQLKIQELRKYATEELGEGFNIREFHDHVLGNGAVPLSILEKKIKEYVEAKKKS